MFTSYNNSHECRKATRAYQYGVPLKELHLCTAVVPRDETPKSAVNETNTYSLIIKYP